MIVVDTTVLVYAVGTEHRFRDPGAFDAVLAATAAARQATALVSADVAFSEAAGVHVVPDDTGVASLDRG